MTTTDTPSVPARLSCPFCGTRNADETCPGPNQDHCWECLRPYDKCLCCGDCEQYPCVCDPPEEPTRSGETPWERRGDEIVQGAYTHSGEAWPDLDRQLDPCQAAGDFYLLEALEAGVVNRPHRGADVAHYWNDSPRLRVIRREAGAMHRQLVDRVYPVFAAYVDMACGGEVRYHGACRRISPFSHGRESAWLYWRSVRDSIGVQALRDAAELFYEFGEQTSYGGPKWAAGAELLYDALTGRITRAQFVDRVFSLQHNGGCFINKVEWSVKNPAGWGLSEMQHKVLPAHGQDQYGTLLRVASKDTHAIWQDYWLASNVVRSAVGAGCVQNTYGKHASVCRWCRRVSGHNLLCLYRPARRIVSDDVCTAPPAVTGNTIHMNPDLVVKWSSVSNDAHHKSVYLRDLARVQLKPRRGHARGVFIVRLDNGLTPLIDKNWAWRAPKEMSALVLLTTTRTVTIQGQTYNLDWTDLIKETLG